MSKSSPPDCTKTFIRSEPLSPGSESRRRSGSESPYFGEGESGQPLVQRAGHRQKRGLVNLDGQVRVHRSNQTASDGGDQKHLVAGHFDQLDPLQQRVVDAWRDGHTEFVRDQAQRPRRVTHEHLDRGRPGAFDLLFEEGALTCRGLMGLHESVHEEPVREIGRHATRGGMGVEEIPLLLQVAHGVADRRRRHP